MISSSDIISTKCGRIDPICMVLRRRWSDRPTWQIIKTLDHHMSANQCRIRRDISRFRFCPGTWMIQAKRVHNFKDFHERSLIIDWLAPEKKKCTWLTLVVQNMKPYWWNLWGMPVKRYVLTFYSRHNPFVDKQGWPCLHVYLFSLDCNWLHLYFKFVNRCLSSFFVHLYRG